MKHSYWLENVKADFLKEVMVEPSLAAKRARYQGQGGRNCGKQGSECAHKYKKHDMLLPGMVRGL